MIQCVTPHPHPQPTNASEATNVKGFDQPRKVKVVIREVTFPKVTIAVCAILLLAAVTFSWFHLTLSTDQNELLTPKLKFFRDYADFATLFP